MHKNAEEGRNAVRAGPPRRERRAEEAAQGSQDLRRRRAAGARRGAEDHRPAHRADRRPAEEEGSGAAREIAEFDLMLSYLLPSRMLACPAAPGRSIRGHAPSLPLRRAAARPLRSRRRRARGRATRSADARPNMWRYRELMPLFDGEEPVTLGEGWTPLSTRARLGADLGLDAAVRQGRVAQPDQLVQGARAVGGRDARALSRRRRLLSVPTAGNAGNAMAAYAARAGLEAKVFMPRDVKRPFIHECELYGAEVTLVDGLITDAGRIAAERGEAARLVRRLDAQGAVPHRRQEDDGLRAGRAARTGRCPTGSSIPPAAAPAWSACGRRSRRWKRIGWIDRRRGRRWSRCRPQAARRSCAPSSKAPKRCDLWRTRNTIADGLRVPSAIGDFLVLRAVRESGGTAVAVGRRRDGRRACATSDASKASAPRPKAAPRSTRPASCSHERPHQAAPTRSCVFNTGGALKYLDVL